MNTADEDNMQQVFVQLLKVAARLDAMYRHDDPYLHGLVTKAEAIAATFENASEQNEEITRQ